MPEELPEVFVDEWPASVSAAIALDSPEIKFIPIDSLPNALPALDTTFSVWGFEGLLAITSDLLFWPAKTGTPFFSPTSALEVNGVDFGCSSAATFPSEVSFAEATVPALFVSAHSETVLTYAIKRKNSDMVKSLIQYKVDVNKIYKGQNPLRLAVAKKQTKIVEQLLKAGAKPDEKTIQLVQKSKDEYLKDLFSSYIK